ncbi:MAG: membrane integrity-associated transporter subunit PqiC [Lentisphaerae bacterium]|nr:membrane integrity-associated transporter subunit PqiC [Lentisphaerota bacterium]
MKIQRSARVGGMAAALFVAGCASSPAVRYYALSARLRPEATVPNVPPPRVITVGPVALADYLNHPNVTVRRVSGGAQTLVHLELDRWGGSFRDAVTRAVSDNLAAELSPQNVLVVPRSDTAAGDLGVSLSINRFERNGARVELQGAWFLTDTATRQVRAAGALQASAPVADGGAAATVAAMSRALESACGELAGRVRETCMQPAAGGDGGTPAP